MKTFKATMYLPGSNDNPHEVGDAIENRDGSISVRLRALTMPFDGRLTLRPDEPQPRDVIADSSKGLTGRVEIGTKGWRCDPAARRAILYTSTAPGGGGPMEADRTRGGGTGYLAIRCDCQGTKPGHEKIAPANSASSSTCAVPNDGVER